MNRQSVAPKKHPRSHDAVSSEGTWRIAYISNRYTHTLTDKPNAHQTLICPHSINHTSRPTQKLLRVYFSIQKNTSSCSPFATRSSLRMHVHTITTASDYRSDSQPNGYKKLFYINSVILFYYVVLKNVIV